MNKKPPCINSCFCNTIFSILPKIAEGFDAQSHDKLNGSWMSKTNKSSSGSSLIKKLMSIYSKKYLPSYRNRNWCVWGRGVSEKNLQSVYKSRTASTSNVLQTLQHGKIAGNLCHFCLFHLWLCQLLILHSY